MPAYLPEPSLPPSALPALPAFLWTTAHVAACYDTIRLFTTTPFPPPPYCYSPALLPSPVVAGIAGGRTCRYGRHEQPPPAFALTNILPSYTLRSGWTTDRLSGCTLPLVTHTGHTPWLHACVT